MGNNDLRKIATITESDYQTISNSVVAVDAHNWLYKYITITVKWNDSSLYTTPDGMHEYPNIHGILKGLPKFFRHNIRPIFVFDGTPHSLKQDEINKRVSKREQTKTRANQARENGNTQEARRLDSQSQRLTHDILRTSHELFAMLDIPTVIAPSAGEAQASHMVQSDPHIDYILSSDYDALLFGADKTIRNFTGRGNPEIMDFQQTIDTHNITHEELIEIAILCGTDYNDGVYGVGPVTSLNAVTDYDTIQEFLDEKNETITNFNQIKELYLSPNVHDDWVIPHRLNPDFNAVYEYTTNTLQLKDSELQSKISHLRQTHHRKD